jgi:hypothetical protein
MAKQKKKSVRVHILNPVPGGHDSCDLARALRYVRQGRARVIDPTDPQCRTIEFIEHDFRHVAAASSAAGQLLSNPTSPTPMPVGICSFAESMRTFARYPDDAENFSYGEKAA